ncbi:MAG: hypothetical protein JWM78_3340 [Verrucomicrobiaceae bacterium]|nr:hypothetical protein [Verrucomicrobiaceae bacterium]
MRAIVKALDKNLESKLDNRQAGTTLAAAENKRPDMLPVILDVEASGLGRGSYPIEVGYVLADQRSHCMLIKPLPEWLRWDVAAEKLHGIQRAQLLQFGVDIKTAAQILNESLRGLTVYSDAWGNDQSWLALLFEHAGFLPAFKLRTLRELLSDAQLEVWQPTKIAVVKELALGRHRASNDARILQLTYLRTCELTGGDPGFRKRA